jgi:hypothetical protein
MDLAGDDDVIEDAAAVIRGEIGHDLAPAGWAHGRRRASPWRRISTIFSPLPDVRPLCGAMSTMGNDSRSIAAGIVDDNIEGRRLPVRRIVETVGDVGTVEYRIAGA